jgi:hypothetical protein
MPWSMPVGLAGASFLPVSPLEGAPSPPWQLHVVLSVEIVSGASLALSPREQGPVEVDGLL